jgi:hypothetical protein
MAENSPPIPWVYNLRDNKHILIYKFTQVEEDVFMCPTNSKTPKSPAALDTLLDLWGDGKLPRIKHKIVSHNLSLSLSLSPLSFISVSGLSSLHLWSHLFVCLLKTESFYVARQVLISTCFNLQRDGMTATCHTWLSFNVTKCLLGVILIKILRGQYYSSHLRVVETGEQQR